MNHLTSRAVGIALLALNLPACETIKGAFPDKMQDYRYSKEIPPLELPPELKSDTIKLDDDLHPTVTPPSSTAISEAPATNAAAVEVPAQATETAEKPQQTLVAWADGNSRLLINAAYDKAWLIVSKALTHKAIEITDRDRSQGVFFVEYDPNKYEIRDGSVWDEVAFFFGKRNSEDRPYRVRVIENGEQTQVAVTDENDVPVTQDPGLSLLQLLYDTIKADAEGKPISNDEETQKSDSEESPKTGDEQQSSGEKEAPPAGDANKPQ